MAVRDLRSPRADAAVAEELRQEYDRWTEALANGDPDGIRELIDDQWSYTDGTGTVRGKEEYLRLVATSPRCNLRTVEFAVLAVGEVATIRATWITSAALGTGVELSATTRHTGVWFRAEAGWRSLVHHVTTLNDSALRWPGEAA